MKGIDKYIDQSFLQGKTLIEVGGGYGHNGEEFHKRGSIVTVTDARNEHLDVGKKLFPHLTFALLDCENDSFDKHYDICLHWGTLYHISNVEEHLQRVCASCDYLFLEHECSDTDECINVKIYENPQCTDQSFSGTGSRPGPNYTMSLLDKHNFEYKMILDPILNVHDYRYEWPVTNSKSYARCHRRFWICWRKGLPSPLRST